MAAHYERMEPI